MKVSVIIPVYNKAPFIQETIKSVLSQPHSDFELLIVDDGSVDGTQEIIQKFSDARIQFHQNEKNLGTAGIGNKMMSLASCEYVIRLDGDDLMCENRIHDQVEFMESNKEIIGSSGHLECFGRFNEIWKQPLQHDEIWSKVLFKCPVIQGASILRKSAWDKFGFSYDERSKNLGEDWLLWFKIGLKGKLGNLNKNVIKYRLESDNLTTERNNYYFESRNFLYREMFAELSLPEEFLDIHILTKPEFNGKPVKGDIKKFFKWMKRLAEINQERDLFPSELFSKELKLRKQKLFYFLMDKDRKLFKTYLMNNGGVSLTQFNYYLKSRKGK